MKRADEIVEQLALLYMKGTLVGTPDEVQALGMRAQQMLSVKKQMEITARALNRAVAVLVLVLGSILPAEALLFDSGSVSTSASVDLAPGFHLYGAGGAVSGWPSQSQVYGPTLWAQTQPLNAPIDLSTVVLLRTEYVTGALHFDVAPFTIARAPGGVEKVFAESPLTVHGVVEWPSGRADVLGEGLLHYTGITDGGGVYAWGLSYDFGREVAATPEPATLLLIGTGLIAGGLRARGLSRRRRRTAGA